MLEAKGFEINKGNIQDTSWARFASILFYKAERAGRTIIEVDLRNTSKTCFGCSNLKDLTLQDRQYHGDACGIAMDRDINAAINIRRLGTSLAVCKNTSEAHDFSHEWCTKMNQSVSKRDLWRYVNRKINRSVHRYHVFAVINILFEEMVKDLKNGHPIKIDNLGTITLQRTKPRWYHHVTLRKMILSPGHRILRFFLARPIRKKLVDFLDLDKTLSPS